MLKIQNNVFQKIILFINILAAVLGLHFIVLASTPGLLQEQNPNMTKTQSHAKRELDILVASATDPDNRPIIEPFIPEILALCEKFGESGQSGGSAPYTATALSSAIKNLCLQKNICPIMGTDDEWGTVADNVNQNNRVSAIFKDAEGAYYLDAITWRTQKGTTWSGTAILFSGERITSRQRIKSFPFEPKTFVIDVTEREVAKDDWEFHINNTDDLIPVFEYYNKYQPTIS